MMKTELSITKRVNTLSPDKLNLFIHKLKKYFFCHIERENKIFTVQQIIPKLR